MELLLQSIAMDWPVLLTDILFTKRIKEMLYFSSQDYKKNL